MRWLAWMICVASVAAGAARATPDILTERNDNARTGANTGETVLTPATVGGGHFGKLWSWRIPGSIQAQPLYAAGLVLPTIGARNVLFVATMNNIVTALDADDPAAAPLWRRALDRPATGSTPVPIVDIVADNTLNIVGNVGIAGTPVIDRAAGTMYLVARTKENGAYIQRLHALDITTGRPRRGSPVTIAGGVAGSGNGSSAGWLAFDTLLHNQRAGLALAGGRLLLAWGSHEDDGAYHGWVMAYDPATLRQTGIWCASPNGAGDGIWMAGHAPAVDAAGNAYVTTGNGTWDGVTEFGNSVVKLGGTTGAAPLDWFTPDNWSDMNAFDADFGSSGPLLVPGTDLLVAGGKTGTIFVLHTGALGQEQAGNGQAAQAFYNGGEIKGGAVFWSRAGDGDGQLYVWADAAAARRYRFNGGGFDTPPAAQSTVLSAQGAANGVLTLSANGTQWGSGVLWSSMPTEDADHGVHHGVLRALDAQTMAELWNSDAERARDNAGWWPKYSGPVVANGHVYLASFPRNGIGTGLINVYGVLP